MLWVQNPYWYIKISGAIGMARPMPDGNRENFSETWRAASDQCNQSLRQYPQSYASSGIEFIFVFSDW